MTTAHKIPKHKMTDIKSQIPWHIHNKHTLNYRAPAHDCTRQQEAEPGSCPEFLLRDSAIEGITAWDRDSIVQSSAGVEM